MNKFSNSTLKLRELVESDVTDEYLSWFQDDIVTRFLEAKNLKKQEVLEYIWKGRDTKTFFIYAICDRISEKHIGNLKIGPIDKINQISDLVTVIGDKNFSGRGLGSKAIEMGNRIAFENFGLRKLTGGIYSDNIASIKAYLRAGWIIEGRLVGHYVKNGKYMDRVIVSCFNEKYFQFNEEKKWELRNDRI